MGQEGWETATHGEQCWSSAGAVPEWLALCYGTVLEELQPMGSTHENNLGRTGGTHGAEVESDHTTTVLFVTQHGAQGLRAHQGLLYSLDSVQGFIQTFSRGNSSQLSQAPLLRILPNKLPREEAKQSILLLLFERNLSSCN